MSDVHFVLIEVSQAVTPSQLEVDYAEIFASEGNMYSRDSDTLRATNWEAGIAENSRLGLTAKVAPSLPQVHHDVLELH